MANIQVTTLIDENDESLNQGAGNSLREAINFAGTGDTITFANNIDGGTINLTNGELVIDKSITIDGNETNRVTINAQGNSRVFNINDSNNFIRRQVGIDGVVITGGNASGSGPNQSDGGGIFTNEALTLSNSIVTGNTAIGGVADGGGIYVNSIGSANITNTTISNNTATDDGGGVFGFGTTNITNSTINNNVAIAATGDGGGVYIVGDTNITNSTISGNIANSEGGGVYVKAGSRPDATITNTTITNNQAPVGKGSGLAAFGSIQNTTVTSSIIAGNVNSDVDELTGGSNAIQSGGNNLIGTGNATTKFNVTTDITGVTNPGLEPLVDNGGPTQTHALQVGSIGIDAGSNSQGLTTDQRGAGFQRVIGNGIDIGAFEFGNPIPTPEPTPTPTPTPGPTPTPTPTPNTIFGTASDDSFNGDNQNNIIDGLEGADTIDGQGGNDKLLGNTGADSLDGGTGEDTLDGGSENDTLDGGTGNDNLVGDAGDDQLNGGTGNDTLDGGTGNDTIDGGLGNDSLVGGNDSSDTFVLRSGDGSDTISDFELGTDTLSLKDGLTFNDLTVVASGANTILRETATSQDLATLSNVNPADFTSQFFISNTIFGTAGDDNSLNGDNQNNSIDGLGGGDTINGQDGNDTLLGNTGGDHLNGGSGNDILDGGSENDTLGGDNGNDSLIGGTGNDQLNGGSDDDTLDGGTGNDSLVGDAGDDQLNGGTDDDTLDGGTGNDTIDGGLGNDNLVGGTGSSDTFVLRSGDGSDTISDFEIGTDTLSLKDGLTFNDLTVVASGANTILRETATSQDLATLSNVNPADFASQFLIGFVGTGGNDSLTGSTGNDTIDGGDGNDTINGGLSKDNLTGGLGDDNLTGGDGNDTIDGGPGNDNLTGSLGNDTFVLSAGEGIDTILDYQDGIDSILLKNLTYGISGDVYSQASGNDTILYLTNGGGNLATLVSIPATDIDSSDFVV